MRLFQLFCALVMVILLTPFTAGAGDKAFFFVVAYSYHQKVAYESSVLEHEVKSKSFNDEEYVADMKLIRAIEDAFQKFLRNDKQINIPDLVFAAHTGYKSAAIATSKMEKEKGDLRFKGLNVIAVPDFKY